MVSALYERDIFLKGRIGHVFVNPSEGAVEGLLQSTMAGSLNTQRKGQPTCLWKQAQTLKKEESYYSERTNCRALTDRGRFSGLGPGEGTVSALTAGTATRPSGSGRTSGLGKDVPAPAGGSVRRVPGAAR